MGLLEKIFGKKKVTFSGRLEGRSPAIDNVTMTSADTEYSFALPAETKKFTIATRDRTAFRIAWVAGKVATPTEPYFSFSAGEVYYEDFVDFILEKMIYFASSSPGKVMDILVWT